MMRSATTRYLVLLFCFAKTASGTNMDLPFDQPMLEKIETMDNEMHHAPPPERMDPHRSPLTELHEPQMEIQCEHCFVGEAMNKTRSDNLVHYYGLFLFNLGDQLEVRNVRSDLKEFVFKVNGTVTDRMKVYPKMGITADQVQFQFTFTESRQLLDLWVEVPPKN